MEHDVVFADEVHELGVVVLPPLLPCAPALGVALAELLRVTDVADGCVEPYIEHFSFGTVDGNGDAPVEVARHGTGLQVHVEPRLALPVDVRPPLFVAFENPLLEPFLIFVQRQVPVLGLLHHGRGARDGRLRVDELGGREVAPAFLALVAVGAFVVAVRTLAGDVAVGQELMGLFVVELLGGLLGELAFVVELAEEVGGKLMMGLRGGAAIHVERDAELLERVFDERVVAVDHILRGDALLAGTDGDGHTVLVASADEHHVFFLQAKVAHVDVGRHIYTGQMAYVNTAVGIGKGSRDGGPLIVFLFHSCFLNRVRFFLSA